jgi:SAM-dependent methyltransferase
MQGVKPVSTIQRFYDVNAEREWQRLSFERKAHSWLEFRVAMHIMDKYLPAAPALVLDVGGGPGRYTIALAQKGYRVTLFDLSGESLALARCNAAEVGVASQVRGYEQGSATDLGRFMDGSFDVVLVMGPLYHLVDEVDRLAAVRESLRVLRPGGIVVAAIINHLGLIRTCLTRFPHEFLKPGILELARSYTQLAADLEGDGFTEAYFAHPLELRRWYEEAGARTVSMAAQEGLAGGLEEACQQLAEDKEAWARWEQLVLATCEDPTILGGSEHTLYVGRKERA